MLTSRLMLRIYISPISVSFVNMCPSNAANGLEFNKIQIILNIFAGTRIFSRTYIRYISESRRWLTHQHTTWGGCQNVRPYYKSKSGPHHFPSPSRDTQPSTWPSPLCPRDRVPASRAPGTREWGSRTAAGHIVSGLRATSCSPRRTRTLRRLCRCRPPNSGESRPGSPRYRLWRMSLWVSYCVTVNQKPARSRVENYSYGILLKKHGVMSYVCCCLICRKKTSRKVNPSVSRIKFC